MIKLSTVQQFQALMKCFSSLEARKVGKEVLGGLGNSGSPSVFWKQEMNELLMIERLLQKKIFHLLLVKVKKHT